MAIFYNYIKGCGEGATNTKNDLKQESWTFLKWANKCIDTTNDTASALPEIHLTTNSTYPTGETGITNLGKIITSNATGQSMNQDFSFQRDCIFGPSISGSNKGYFHYYSGRSIDFLMFHSPYLAFSYNDNPIQMEINGTLQFPQYSKERLDDNQEEPIGTKISHEAVQSSFLYIGNLNTFKEDNIIKKEEGSIYAQNKCEALYFNATSDRRAKDNIRLSTFNGLDLVKALQIYNFNYAEQKTPSIGIMAQDAAEHDIEDFELVTNKEATGENGDFMSIKESKLVYVLWKAVQELSAEVDDLKAQLKNK